MGKHFGWHSGKVEAAEVLIGNGTTVKKIEAFTPTIDPASIAADTVTSQTFTINGLTTDDIVIVNPGIDTIAVAGAYVSSADTLTVIFSNPTAAAIDAASSTWKIIAIKT